MVEQQPRPTKICDTSLLDDALIKKLPSLVFSVSSARFQSAETKSVITCHLGIKDIAINLSLEIGPSKTSSVPILSKAYDHLSATKQFPIFEKSPSKMSPGRARPGAIFSKLSSLEDSPKFDVLHAHFQFPISSNQQKVTTLVSVQIAEFHFLLDPKLFEWIIYHPESKNGGQPDLLTDHSAKKGVAQKKIAR